MALTSRTETVMGELKFFLGLSFKKQKTDTKKHKDNSEKPNSQELRQALIKNFHKKVKILRKGD